MIVLFRAAKLGRALTEYKAASIVAGKAEPAKAQGKSHVNGRLLERYVPNALPELRHLTLCLQNPV